MLEPYILLYNYTLEDHPLFISANYINALLYIRSDDTELIREVGFKVDLSNVDGYIFSLGYNGRVDTWIDFDEDGIRDIFESRAFQWSRESLGDA